MKLAGKRADVSTDGKQSPQVAGFLAVRNLTVVGELRIRKGDNSASGNFDCCWGIGD